MKLLILIVFCIETTALDFKVVFQNFECNYYNPKYVSNLTCKIRLISSTERRLDFYLAPQPEVTDLFDNLRVQAFQRYGDIYKPTQFDMELNLCKSVKINNPMYWLIYNVLNNSFNMTYACSITETINASNIFIKDLHIPPILPVGMWRLDTDFRSTDQQDSRFRINIYTSITDEDDKDFHD